MKFPISPPPGRVVRRWKDTAGNAYRQMRDGRVYSREAVYAEHSPYGWTLTLSEGVHNENNGVVQSNVVLHEVP